MAKLSTHVLDTMAGRPAANMSLVLRYFTVGKWVTIIEAVTNQDGRTDAPLLTGERIETGDYEIEFDVEAYFKGQNVKDAGRFLGKVPLRFSIDDAAGNYHVPLLVSPWAYSTYRGS